MILQLLSRCRGEPDDVDVAGFGLEHEGIRNAFHVYFIPCDDDLFGFFPPWTFHCDLDSGSLGPHELEGNLIPFYTDGRVSFDGHNAVTGSQTNFIRRAIDHDRHDGDLIPYDIKRDANTGVAFITLVPAFEVFAGEVRGMRIEVGYHTFDGALYELLRIFFLDVFIFNRDDDFTEELYFCVQGFSVSVDSG